VDILGLIGVRDVRNGAAIGLVWMYMREMEGVEWVDKQQEGPIGRHGTLLGVGKSFSSAWRNTILRSRLSKIPLPILAV